MRALCKSWAAAGWLLLWAGAAMPSSAAERELAATDLRLQRGSTNCLAVSLQASGNENALGFSLCFDPAQLTFASARLGAGAQGAGWFMNQSRLAQGRLGFAIGLAAGRNFAPGSNVVVEVCFSAAAGGNTVTTPVAICDQPVPRELVDSGARLLAATYRDATVTIAGDCGYRLDRHSASVPAGGGLGAVEVTAKAGCDWSVISSNAWITILSDTNGLGNGRVDYAVSANGGSTSRTGTVRIADQLFSILQAGSSASGNEFWVSNPEEIVQALDRAGPGDTVILRHGVWRDADILFHGHGTEGRPITLRAEVPGQVWLSGQSRLRLAGSWLVVEGLVFTNGFVSSGDVITFRSENNLEASHCRLTQCAILDYNPPLAGRDSKWISLYGLSNRVDHCWLQGKANEGSSLVVWVDPQPNRPNYHRIDHNFFGPRPASGVNAGETIRVGTSDVSLNLSRTVVEANYFLQCNGDVEIISSKSGENIYRHNTFVECQGALTLRHGNGSVVEGNFFFGRHQPLTGGVRIIGEDHRVFNNYFADLDGTSSRAALSLMQGLVNSPLNGYFQVKRAVVAFNTFVNCRQSLLVGLPGTLSGTALRTTLPPLDCTMANNLVQAAGGQLVDQRIAPVNLRWEGNLMHGGVLGIPTNSGIQLADPALALSADGLWRPGLDSPALGAARGNYAFVEEDFDGQPRPAAKDIGGDQWSTAPVTRRPLTEQEVGPAWRRLALPVVHWPTPADMVYPAALSTAQLNATANVPGTFQYSPPLGTGLNAGAAQRLSVTFTPEDSAQYSPVIQTVPLNVLPATPEVDWATPPDLVYGTPLDAAQLNATASVSGAMVYNPPAGTVLNAGLGQVLSVTFRPADPVNYEPVIWTVRLNVLPAAPLVQWPNPAGITRGTPLGPLQLNATAETPGTFIYTPPTGTVLGLGPAQPLRVDFTPDDRLNYLPVTRTVFIAVTNAVQLIPRITWPAPADIPVGTALSDAQLNATVEVPGTLVYAPPAGTVLPARHGQVLEVFFTPADTNRYAPASATVTINVLRPTPTVRVAYVVPSNRAAQTDAVIKLRNALKLYRDWFREQMDRNGFGPKTFTLETEADGWTPRVHVVSVAPTDLELAGDVTGNQTFDAARSAGLPLGTPGQVWWVVAETHRQNPDGSLFGGFHLSRREEDQSDSAGWALTSADTLALAATAYVTSNRLYHGLLLPDLGPYPMRQEVTFPEFDGPTLSSVSSSALGAGLRDLALAFGLEHDFRNDENFNGNLTGFGYRGLRGNLAPGQFPFNGTRLPRGLALALNVSPFFNPGRPYYDDRLPQVNITSGATATPFHGAVQVTFEAEDAGGLAVALLAWRQATDWRLVGELELSGTRTAKTFTTPYYNPGQSNEYRVTVLDREGNRHSATRQIVPEVPVNRAPRPFIQLDRDAVGLGEDLTLDGSATFDAEHALALLEFEWDLNGDGIFDTPPVTSPRFITRYLTPGPRLIRARVTDPAGAESVSAPVAVQVTLCPTVLSPASRTHGYGATAGTVQVEAGGQCHWSVVNTNDWITVDAQPSYTGNGSIAYTLEANPGLAARTGGLLVGGEVFTITQEGLACAYNISPPHKFHGFGNVSGATTVKTKTQCPWTVVNTNDWITLTSAANLTGPGQITYTLAANRTDRPRTGVLTVADQLFRITQWGTNCGYYLEPSLVAHNGSAATGQVNVATSSACAWDVVNTNQWITILSGQNGAGSGTVTYRVTANPGPARRGQLVLAGQAVTVAQDTLTRQVRMQDAVAPSGQMVCVPVLLAAYGGERAFQFSLNFDPQLLEFASVRLDANVQDAGLTVNSNQLAGGMLGCTVSLPAGATFVPGAQPVFEVCFATAPTASLVTSPIALGNTPVPSEVTSLDGRSLPASFAGATVVLVGTCVYSLASTSAAFDAEGGVGQIILNAGNGCAWTAMNTNDWILPTTATNGVGHGTIAFTVLPNPTQSPRTGVVSIAGEPFTINQAAATCAIVLSPTHRVHGYEAETDTVGVSTLATCAWTVNNTNRWMAIKLTTNGIGSGSVRYVVYRNLDPAPRVGVFTVGGEVFSITQLGSPCTIALSPAQRQHGAGEETGTLNVLANPECRWSLVNTNHWIRFDSATSGSGDALLQYTVAPSLTRSLRTGVVEVAGQTFAVTQLGSACSVSISPKSETRGFGPMTGTVRVSPRSGCSGVTWQVVNTNDWILITSPGSGTGKGTVSYQLTRNTAGVPRTGVVVIGDQGFALTQKGDDCAYTLSPAHRSHSGKVETGAIAIATAGECSWAVVNTNDWITLTSNATGVGPATVNYRVSVNAGPDRTGTLVIGGRPFRVDQASGLRRLRFESLSLAPGETNWLRVVLESRGDESVLRFSMCFDTNRLLFVSARPGAASATASLRVDTDYALSGRVGVLWDLPAGESLSAGAQGIVDLAFRSTLRPFPPETTVSWCAVPVEPGLWDGNGLPAPVEFVDGTVEIHEACSLGQAVNAPQLEWTSGGRAAPWICRPDVTFEGESAAATQVVGNKEYAFVKTVVTGPVALGFAWKVSSELNHDYLRFMLDAVDQFRISGEVDWEWRTFDVPAGVHELQWRYSKNLTLSDGQDRAWLDQVHFGPPPPVLLRQPADQNVNGGATARFQVAAVGAPPLHYQWFLNDGALADGAAVSGAATATLTLTDVQPGQAGAYAVRVSNGLGTLMSAAAALRLQGMPTLAGALDAPGHVFATSSSAPWLGQTNTTRDGVDAVRSGAIGRKKTTWMETTVIGPDTVSFWWKVSSEKNDDRLRFYVNGSERARITGEVDWQWRSFNLGSGNQVLRWTYSKDGSTDRGQDRGWVDQVRFGPPAPYIFRQPSSQVVGAGSTVTLAVLASGAAPLNYQWLFNDTPLSASPAIQGVNAATLILDQVQPNQAGRYQVRITNALGAAVSAPADLTVITLAQALDLPVLDWTTGGAAPWSAQAEVTHDGRGAARAGFVSSGQGSWLETTVLGPGLLRFWWKAAAGSDEPMARFYADGVEQAVLSADTDWVEQTVGIPSGTRVLRWVASATDSGSSSGAGVWLDEVRFVPGLTPVPARIIHQPASQDVAPGERVTLHVEATGTAPVSYQWRFGGRDLQEGLAVTGVTGPTLTLPNVRAEQAGLYSVVVRNEYGLDISASAQVRVVPVIPLPEALDNPNLPWQTGGDAPWKGQSTITYDWLDAAESGPISHTESAWVETTVYVPGAVSFHWKVSSQANRDRLRFYVDGVERADISGEVDWQRRTFDVPIGEHVLRWAYTKDSKTSSGQDRGWVDQVQFGPTAPLIAEQPENRRADTGATVTFHAVITNTPDVNHQWRFNGTNLVDQLNVFGSTGSKLILSNAQPAQSGAYSVLAENAGGRAISAAAALQVLNGTPFATALETTSWANPSNRIWSSGWISGGNAFWTAQTSVTHDGLDAVQSGRIYANGETWLKTTLAGPGELSFWWKVDSQATNDQLRVYVGPVMAARIYGNVNWRRQTVHVPAGLQRIELRYRKNPWGDAGADRGWFDQMEFVPADPPVITRQPVSRTVEEGDDVTFDISATGTPPRRYQWYRNGAPLTSGGSISGATSSRLKLSKVQLAQAGIYSATVSNEAAVVTSSNALLTVIPLVPLAEAMDLADGFWNTGGSAPWVGSSQTTRDGVDAGRSGKISHKRDSWAETTVFGPGTLSFWWKVSSEPKNDRLRFYVNGSERARISGEVNWTRRTFTLPAGTQVLRWRYSKNSSRTAGQDRGWVDQVTFEPQAPTITRQPLSQTVDAGDTVTFDVAISGSPPLAYQWLHNGVPLADGASVSGATSATLRLSNVSLTRQGAYAVRVSNVAGQVTSASALLEVVRVLTLAEALDTPGWPWRGAGNVGWRGEAGIGHDGMDAARSGTISANQNTRLEIYVTGPGTVSFWWKVSSEPANDQLRFYIGAVEQTRISGEVDWRFETFDVPAGDQLLKWRYSKDGRRTSGQDRGWVDQVQFHPSGVQLTPTILSAPADQSVGEGGNATFSVGVSGSAPLSFQWLFDGAELVDGGGIRGAQQSILSLSNVQPAHVGRYAVRVSNPVGSVTSPGATLSLLDLAEAVDAPELHFRVAGMASWTPATGITHDGADAARSGRIVHNENTRLETHVDGPGTVQFWWRVSSEPIKDQLRFYIGEVEQTRISGEVGWRQESFDVPAGDQLLKWRYSKDAGGSAGLDAGWVDEVQFVSAAAMLVGSTTNAANLPLRIGITLTSAGAVTLQWAAAPGGIYQVQSTSDLAAQDWVDLGERVVAGDATAQMTDHPAGRAQRFYRVIRMQ